MDDTTFDDIVAGFTDAIAYVKHERVADVEVDSFVVFRKVK